MLLVVNCGLPVLRHKVIIFVHKIVYILTIAFYQLFVMRVVFTVIILSVNGTNITPNSGLST